MGFLDGIVRKKSAAASYSAYCEEAEKSLEGMESSNLQDKGPGESNKDNYNSGILGDSTVNVENIAVYGNVYNKEQKGNEMVDLHNGELQNHNPSSHSEADASLSEIIEELVSRVAFDEQGETPEKPATPFAVTQNFAKPMSHPEQQAQFTPGAGQPVDAKNNPLSHDPGQTVQPTSHIKPAENVEPRPQMQLTSHTQIGQQIPSAEKPQVDAVAQQNNQVQANLQVMQARQAQSVGQVQHVENTPVDQRMLPEYQTQPEAQLQPVSNIQPAEKPQPLVQVSPMAHGCSETVLKPTTQVQQGEQVKPHYQVATEAVPEAPTELKSQVQIEGQAPKGLENSAIAATVKDGESGPATVIPQGPEGVSANYGSVTVDDVDYSILKQTPIKSFEEKAPIDHTIEDTKIIAIINQKGGVGKSTTAINLSAAIGEKGKAVLVIDLDPQGNTTSGLGVDKGQIEHDIYDVILNELDPRKAIIADVCKGLDLIPATINLAGAEVELVNEMARENKLKEALASLRGIYDYIFIDCPPALGLLTINALVVSDKLLIPIQCEFYALEGVTKLLDSMNRVKKSLNPDLETFGVLLTMYDGRTMLSRQVAEEVRNFFGSKVFNAVIPRTVRLSEAPSFGQPITEYDPSGRGAQSYIALAKEVIERG